MEIVPMIAPMASYEEIDLNKKFTNKIALIDADRYKHVVTYRVWQRMMNEGDEHSQALVNEIIDSYLSHDIFNRFEAKAYLFCFSASTGNVFRSVIAQEKAYKGSRKRREDPHFYNEKYDDMGYIFEYISKRYQTLFFDDLEADDILSMLQREETFIFSHDGDMLQVPGTHWNMEKYEFYEISKLDAFRSLIYQILKGAGKDNIGGLSGFGEVALKDFVENVNTTDMREEAMVYSAMKLFTNKHGILNGFDTFVEMWLLCSTRLGRGNYFKEKYITAFYLMENLCKENGSTTTEHNGDAQSERAISR